MNLQGPLKGKEISDLVKLMSDGGAYANVHTDKYPKGAIRGQISSGEARYLLECLQQIAL